MIFHVGVFTVGNEAFSWDAIIAHTHTGMNITHRTKHARTHTLHASSPEAVLCSTITLEIKADY